MGVIKTKVYKEDYDFFLEYLELEFDGIYTIENGENKDIPFNPGEWVSIALKYYLETLEKHRKAIESYTLYFFTHFTEEIKKLETVKITGVDTLTLEKFKTYIEDKHGTLEPFLGLKLSQALTIYLEEQFINPIWLNENEYPPEEEEVYST